MSFAQPSLPPLESSFSDYHREFYASLTTANNAVQSAADQQPKQAAQTLLDADTALSEAADLLKTLELEAQSQQLQLRNKLRPYVTQGRNALSDAGKALRATRIAVSQRQEVADRTNLFDRAPDDVRIQMTSNTSLVERSNELITDSRRHIAETELIGASILEDLQSQRSTITRARNNLGNMSNGLQQSDSILNTMHRRAMANRIMVYVILAIIGIACVAIMYVRIFHSRKRD
ncbi:unnamed protein product [Agarophyton chilense]|eukprot:gb/GEZJ01002314.1/.p2 GENE.gb/GEZJ01002314.1/~~gb/GEZJ01002314.1/.p2  ORF type:complete len:243 (+),score=42.26 gb/GEZJ01002314.1/:33-731(+)